jgi:hypothetical protein
MVRGGPAISSADCPSALFVADFMTKQTGRTKFYEHMHFNIGGRQPVAVCRQTRPSVQSTPSLLLPNNLYHPVSTVEPPVN